MLSFLKSIIKPTNILKVFDQHEKELKRLRERVAVINSIGSDIEQKTDDEIRNLAINLKYDVRSGRRQLTDVMPEAFALVREAAMRSIDQRHYDVQVMGGIVLAEGKIAEMKTGEGKTLTATLPAFYHALLGKGVHIATANDYLAKRDADYMGRVYNFLGMSVGKIIPQTPYDQRKEMYDRDITYATANELGFNELRDNLVKRVEDLVQREKYFALIDEVDCILIDEAKTPLIISGSTSGTSDLYELLNRYVSKIDHSMVKHDIKTKSVGLLENGIDFLESLLKQDGIIEEDLYSSSNAKKVAVIQKLLEAHFAYRNDVDYIVQNDRAVIIDEFTGRILDGRRYSDGLHQAIEAKEKIHVYEESVTLATTTMQNFFRKYPILAGMSGTAVTDQKEFREIYGLEVVQIPTNRPMIRKDLPDEIFKTMDEKAEAVVSLIENCHSRQQPVLIGTLSIEQSEWLSEKLKQHKLPHRVLNAKYHELEAHIIANSGTPGSIVIATNMAGRGTDIELGGNLEARIQSAIAGVPKDQHEKIIKMVKQQREKDAEIVKEAGGLYVIVLEMNESLRIDNQLRGRTGRQGDPGVTCRFLSLSSDRVLVSYGGKELANLLEVVGVDSSRDSRDFVSGGMIAMIANVANSAQRQFSSMAYESRKSTLRYDEVIDSYRNYLMTNRKEILVGKFDSKAELGSAIAWVVSDIVSQSIDQIQQKFNKEMLMNLCRENFGIELNKIPESHSTQNESYVKQLILSRANEILDSINQEELVELVRTNLIEAIDSAWRDCLAAFANVRNSISMRSYAQKDPFNEYQNETSMIFDIAINQAKYDAVKAVFFYGYIADDREIVPDKTIEKLGADDQTKVHDAQKMIDSLRSVFDKIGKGT